MVHLYPDKIQVNNVRLIINRSSVAASVGDGHRNDVRVAPRGLVLTRKESPVDSVVYRVGTYYEKHVVAQQSRSSAAVSPNTRMRSICIQIVAERVRRLSHMAASIVAARAGTQRHRPADRETCQQNLTRGSDYSGDISGSPGQWIVNSEVDRGS